MSLEALETKYTANCIYGGWDSKLASETLALLKQIRTSSNIDLTLFRN